MNNIETLFKKQMFENVCDFAETLFTSEVEKTEFINKAWEDYGDDIEEHINGAVGDTFNEQPTKEKERLIREAIKDNFESIFDKLFDE